MYAAYTVIFCKKKKVKMAKPLHIFATKDMTVFVILMFETVTNWPAMIFDPFIHNIF